MIKKIYLELTKDEIEVLEKAEEIMSAIVREAQSSYDNSISMSGDDKYTIMNLAAAGSQVMKYSAAFSLRSKEHEWIE